MKKSLEKTTNDFLNKCHIPIETFNKPVYEVDTTGKSNSYNLIYTKRLPWGDTIYLQTIYFEATMGGDDQIFINGNFDYLIHYTEKQRDSLRLKKFDDIFPFDSTQIKFSKNQINIEKKYQFTKSSEQLLWFLKNNYFWYKGIENNKIIIQFYDDFAKKTKRVKGDSNKQGAELELDTINKAITITPILLGPKYDTSW